MHRENAIIIGESLESVVVNTIVEIKSRLGETKIKAETINEILKDTIEIVEKLDVKGDEKREIAVKVIKNLVDDLVDDNDEKKLINDMIDKKILSSTIDLIIL
jgi:DNA-binding ferritin-like protein (Dps family)